MSHHTLCISASRCTRKPLPSRISLAMHLSESVTSVSITCCESQSHTCSYLWLHHQQCLSESCCTYVQSPVVHLSESVSPAKHCSQSGAPTFYHGPCKSARHLHLCPSPALYLSELVAIVSITSTRRNLVYSFVYGKLSSN